MSDPRMPWNERTKRRLKLRDLDILTVLIEAGSMGKAASRLNVSQPAVSKAIAELEHALGVRLVDRGRRGIMPTPYGLALQKRSVAIFLELVMMSRPGICRNCFSNGVAMLFAIVIGSAPGYAQLT